MRMLQGVCFTTVHELWGAQITVVIPPYALDGANAAAVRALQVGAATSTCPSGRRVRLLHCSGHCQLGYPGDHCLCSCSAARMCSDGLKSVSYAKSA